MPSGPTPEPASRGRGHGPLVLVVEDELLLALDLELLLQRHGFRVLGPAATVAEALRLLEGGTPDAALLDVNLRARWCAGGGDAAGTGRAVRGGERLRRRAARGAGPGRGAGT